MPDKRFLSIEDLASLPKPQWMIEGLFEANSLVMVAGPEASYKSFMAIDWMLCMASGKKWHKKATTPAKVLYVLGEGKASLLKRLQTWIHHYKPTTEQKLRLVDNFRVSWDVPQMAMKSSVDNMLAELVAEGYNPNVIVIDTFARSFVGLDENSQKDTGLWIENADRLRQLGYTVIFLHHTNKNTEFGFKYRGSTAIAGAMDSAFVMHKDQNPSHIKFYCIKQKDHDEGISMFFNRLVVRPFEGDSEGSIVLVPALQIDERFTPEGQEIETSIKRLLSDDSFESDRARARELARLHPSRTENAAQKLMSMARKEHKNLSESENESDSLTTHVSTHL